MRALLAIALLAGLALAQSQPAPSSTATPSATQDSNTSTLTIPTGAKIPVALKHAISTKSAREGDDVYAQTTFPFVLNDRVLVPAGTYIQGKITHVQRAGRLHGRAELLIHFTTLIYPSGYTVVLPGSVENVPGAEKTEMKDKEGTIRQESEKGDKAIKVASNAGKGGMAGGVIGGLSTGARSGAALGAGIGGAAGAAIALLSRGADVRLDSGTTIEMEVQRAITLDASRISSVAR
jgi:hypothetical protein